MPELNQRVVPTVLLGWICSVALEYGFIFHGEDPDMCAIGASRRYFTIDMLLREKHCLTWFANTTIRTQSGKSQMVGAAYYQ